MSKSPDISETSELNLHLMRSLVKQYSELGQWTSALFWADAAASASCEGSVREIIGEDLWLLANAMLARGELHRAAHTVTKQGFHRRHLLCAGVAARAMLEAKEYATVLSNLDECDPILMEPRPNDSTHNRALASILVTRARALSALERREAAAECLAAALKADVTCYEALDLLLDKHSINPVQERELVESLPITAQLPPAEALLLRAAYNDKVKKYFQPDSVEPHEPTNQIEAIRNHTHEAAEQRALHLSGACQWATALKTLKDPWSGLATRTACLVELKKSSELFTFAHSLVDSYPHEWTSWFAVGCYYYLIGKNEFARRYLSKAKSIEPSAGCVWLAYGHSFAADNEHDQAMAAYFKASQLMPGCHLPRLYVAVECSLLNNINVAEKFFAQAAKLYPKTNCEKDGVQCGGEGEGEGEGWASVVRAGDAHVAHEAGVAAFGAGEYRAAELLLHHALTQAEHETSSRWAATLDALGHTVRRLGRPAEALSWHERALCRRPGRAHTLVAAGLCLALGGREARAADTLHAALARDPADAPALALLDLVVDRLHHAYTDEEVPQFPFPAVHLPAAPAAPSPVGADNTNMSDMSMSFD